MSTTADVTIETVDGTTESTHAPTSTPGTAVSAVSIKLPPFWPSDPEIWLVQVEAQFSTRGITSQKTKFEYLVSSLSPEVATEVRDLLLRPPAENPYDRLKAELVKRTAASEQRRLQQLISGEELGDRKPTQLLRRMEQLLGDTAAEANQGFLRELFLQRLPSNVRMVLASGGSTLTLKALADMADKVIEVSSPTISAVQAQPGNSDVSKLQEQVTKLTDLVAALTERRPRGRSLTRQPRSNSRSRHTSPAPASTQQETDPQPGGLCWYHRRFGDAARHCRAPCTWGNE